MKKRVKKCSYIMGMMFCLSIGMMACGKTTEDETTNPTGTIKPTETQAPTQEPEVTVPPTATATPKPTSTPTPTPTPVVVEDAWFDFGNGENMEGIEVIQKCPAKYQKKSKDIDYGEIIKTDYYSTTCEKNRNVIIALPAGYTEEKEYPVLYVLHGIFGDETSMIGDGNSGVRIIMGNLAEEGLAEEAIIVFPYMYASKTREVCTAIDVENTAAYDNFVNDLTADLMPFLAQNYSVASGRENTAIIGFSMGGRESFAIGFTRPDLFGYVGAIAPAPGVTPGTDMFMAHPGQFAEEELVFEGESPFVLMICSGDKDSVVGTFPKSYHEILSTNKVNHIWWEIPGSDHGDPAISSGLYNFCKEIFKYGK